MSITSGALSKSFVVVSDTPPASPFEGQLWVDTSSGNKTKQYKNGTFRTIQLDASKINARFLELVNDVAEARYSSNLAQASMDDVFFDAFVNFNKIASSNSIGVFNGVDGYLSLKTEFPDSFEDNDESDWDTSVGSDSWSTFNSQTNIVAEGNYSLKGEHSNTSGVKARKSIPNDLSPNSITVYLRLASDGISSKFGGWDFLKNGKEIISAQIFGSSKGDYISVNSTTLISSPNRGEWYKIEMDNIDWTNNQIGNVKVDGTQQATNVGFKNNADGLDTQGLEIRSDNGGTLYFDGGTQYNSGSITSTTKNLDFTPSKLQVEQELLTSTSNNDDVEFVISDSNGNTVTIDQTDVGSQVSVNFENGDITVDVNLKNSYIGKIEEYGVLFV